VEIDKRVRGAVRALAVVRRDGGPRREEGAGDDDVAGGKALCPPNFNSLIVLFQVPTPFNFHPALFPSSACFFTYCSALEQLFLSQKIFTDEFPRGTYGSARGHLSDAA
jgi:hypothetical protein